MPSFTPTPPMFVCGGDPFWDDEVVADTVPMVKCQDCGWVGFADGPEEGEVEEAAEERAAGGWWPDPTRLYAANHTLLACRGWQRDHDPDPREQLPGKRGRAFRLHQAGHAKHPSVPLRRRGDGEMYCPTCGFVP